MARGAQKKSAAGPNPKSASMTKKDLENQVNDMQKQLDKCKQIIAVTELEAQREREEAIQRDNEWQQRLEAAEAQVVEAINSANIARAAAIGAPNAQLIEKPKGTISLPDIMEEKANIMNDEYKLILRLLHSVAGLLEVKRSRKDQDKDAETAVKTLMLKHFPVLKRFQNEWPLDEFIQQYLRSQRAHLRRLGLLPKPRPRRYKSTPEERKAQAKRANAIGLEKKRARILRSQAEAVQERARDENIDPNLQ
ncbi:hypothetical protein BDY19DRAFT_997780 [Irpex rosettiformis]|uniref:Uncharacterized protein n=1 Tax=Irpex rosettiformis TaxID=378272 RepID=A0ACB8TQU9_9APHY|nr:hypothetical protein BDY19DRAFT_997780 [Irpex rosettiformis]